MNIKENLDVDYEKYDDTEYMIRFKNKNLRLPYRLITIPIGGNGLFYLQTMPGYTSFCARASTFQCYECYYGA